jgi:hypothetical protein
MATKKEKEIGPIVLRKIDMRIIDKHIAIAGKLPASFKKKWVKALRSGKYKQGTDALRSVTPEEGTRYCCLGVACHVAGASGIKNKELISNDENGKIKSINKVPAILRGEEGVPLVLARYNDRGKTFAQLADVIEKHL